MKSLLSLVLILTASSLTIIAQDLRGYVAEPSGEAIPYASIAVFNDSTFVTAITADSCGMFSAKLSYIDSPRLRASMIGYETLDTLITNSSNPITLTLRYSSIALDEVEVSHTPPVITMKGDAIVTNVAGSALQSIGSARDVLRHVPLISLGSNDAIEVFGRGTPAVYINGRRVNDMRELNQLQSENIKSVDVLTNPGAGYSADIMSVVRIRTIKQRGEGISAQVGISGTYDDHFSNADNLSIRYRNNNIELFAEGNYSVGKHSYTTGNDQLSTNKTGVTRQDAISDRLADMTWMAVKTGLSYNVTQDHSVGASYSYGYWRKYETLDNIQDISLNGIVNERWVMNGIDTTLSAPTHNVNLYYNGDISSMHIDFNADYFERDNTHNFFFNEQNTSAYYNDIFINNSGRSRMLAEKLVISYHHGATSVELGEEFTDSHLQSTSRNTGAPFIGSATKVTERNFAPFAEIRHTWHNVSAGIGLRYEYTVNDFEVSGQNNRDRNLHYSRLFPSASVAWTHSDANISFSFTNKSIRPTYSQLSDILEYSTRTKYWRGNPELESERYYNFQLSAAWRYFFGQVMYTHTRDAIFQTYEPYEDDPDVSLITYRNVPTLNTVSSNIDFRHNVGLWSPTLTMSIAKQWHHLSTVSGRKDLSSPIVRVRFDNTFNLPDNWTAMMSFDFTGGGDSHNQGNKSHHSLDLNISKTFLNGDLIVRADATDLLNKSYLRYSIYNEVGQIDCLDTWTKRSVNLSVRYSFNTTSSRYKGRGAGAAERSRM